MLSLRLISTPSFSLYRYYVLVAIFVFARKYESLRNAGLATALLFPAVAALHGIVLAAVHVNGMTSVSSVLPRLTALCSRRRRYGYLWSFPGMFNSHHGLP